MRGWGGREENEENVLLLWDERVGDGFHTIHWADQHHSRSSKQQSQVKICFESGWIQDFLARSNPDPE